MSAQKFDPRDPSGVSDSELLRKLKNSATPLDGPLGPLRLEVTPESGEERMWYSLGFDEAQTFEAVPIQFRAFYDLGLADRRAGRSPRATWVQEKAVLQPPPEASTASNAATQGAEVVAVTKKDAAPVWPLLLGGAALTVGIGLLLAANKKKRKARLNG